LQHVDAVRLLASPELDAREPQTWADLGCGDGVFTRALASLLAPGGYLLVVEYDTDRANRWVPYPRSRRALTDLCIAVGFARVVALGSHPSIYQRAPLYSVLVG
jgi:predicted methyltransferase